MDLFFKDYSNELLSSLALLAGLLLIKFISTKAIRKVGKLSDLNKSRTKLIIKYSSIGITFMGVAGLLIVWGVNLEDLSLVLSSFFAILGVALFATWSILSNVTAGIILFFAFPFKIGDRIKIQDVDFPLEAIITDIRAFYVELKTNEGTLVTYPNNLFLQKGVALINKQEL
ncbi:MAG: mechanosensitive ion channel [Flavobacteriia bacterium]|nr:mechanosensitive ion channel [Flavobacteriia bacterium]